MEILVFLLVVSNLNLVFTEDNLAVEIGVTPKDTYKVYPKTQDDTSLNDQLAESSQSIIQSYGKAFESNSLTETQDETQNQIQSLEKSTDTNIGQGIHLPNGFRQDAVALKQIQVLQPGFQEKYVHPQQAHTLYLHQYPNQAIQIFGAEASPLQQTHDDKGPKPLGYSSYIEHVSEKDEDLRSALKEGTVSDIKRLVPKSEISFKIYQNEKNFEIQKPEIKSPLLTHYNLKRTAGLSTLHDKIKNELAATPINMQTQQLTLGKLQQPFLKHVAKEKHHDYENFQQLLQSNTQDQQSVNSQTLYFSQPETQKPILEVNEKTSSVGKPPLLINVAESNYNKQATVEMHRHLKPTSKIAKQSFADISKQKQFSNNGLAEGYPKAVESVKNPEKLQCDINPLEENKRFYYTQNLGSSVLNHNPNKHKTVNSFVETGNHYFESDLPNSHEPKLSQINFAGHFTSTAHPDSKLVLSRLSGNYLNTEEIKPVIGHLGTTAYTDRALKSNHFIASVGETAKVNHHDLISQIPKTTNSQNNFDHQKALEGSTSFDIKNAIDSTGSLIHQANYISPSTEIYPLENRQKQQLTYIIPKIPTSTVLIENSVHDTPVTENYHNKGFLYAGILPQLPHHATVTEVNGKIFHRHPQTISWTPEHPKQGPWLSSKDLHQQLIRLHLPKEEIYVKSPNTELPTSTVSHISYSHQQKQPFAIPYDLPYLKSYPQELHFHPNAKTQALTSHANHFKMSQPVTLDWSLLKSRFPNFNLHTLGVTPELNSHGQESGKKIVPILVKKRKNRSSAKQEVGVVYGKVTSNRRPTEPSHRQEKNVRVNLLEQELFDVKKDRNNEFSVSASYKVDRSSKSS